MIRRITLPLLKDLLVIALLLRVMDAYKLFDAAYIITRGGPGTATELPGLLTYLVGFKDFDIGRAAALTWVIAIARRPRHPVALERAAATARRTVIGGWSWDGGWSGSSSPYSP